MVLAGGRDSWKSELVIAPTACGDLSAKVTFSSAEDMRNVSTPQKSPRKLLSILPHSLTLILSFDRTIPRTVSASNTKARALGSHFGIPISNFLFASRIVAAATLAIRLNWICTVESLLVKQRWVQPNSSLERTDGDLQFRLRFRPIDSHQAFILGCDKQRIGSRAADLWIRVQKHTAQLLFDFCPHPRHCHQACIYFDS